MSKYLFIESRDPFDHPGVLETWNLAADLARKGGDVALFLVQNGVLAARRGARVETLDPGVPVRVLADDLSLEERGIAPEALRANVQVSDVDTLTDLVLEDGRKPIWN